MDSYIHGTGSRGHFAFIALMVALEFLLFKQFIIATIIGIPSLVLVGVAAKMCTFENVWYRRSVDDRCGEFPVWWKPVAWFLDLDATPCGCVYATGKRIGNDYPSHDVQNSSPVQLKRTGRNAIAIEYITADMEIATCENCEQRRTQLDVHDNAIEHIHTKETDHIAAFEEEHTVLPIDDLGDHIFMPDDWVVRDES